MRPINGERVSDSCEVKLSDSAAPTGLSVFFPRHMLPNYRAYGAIDVFKVNRREREREMSPIRIRPYKAFGIFYLFNMLPNCRVSGAIACSHGLIPKGVSI